MTLSNTPAEPERTGSGGGGAPRAKRAGLFSGWRRPSDDQDIRNDPRYKTPWWRRPLKPWAFWALAVVLVAIIVAAVIVCILLGIRLF